MNRRLLDMLAGWMNQLCHDIEHAEHDPLPGVTLQELEAESDLVHDLYQAAGTLENPTKDDIRQFVVYNVIPILLFGSDVQNKIKELVGEDFMQRLQYAMKSVQPLSEAAAAALAEGPEISGGVDVEPDDDFSDAGVEYRHLSEEARKALDAGIESARRGEIKALGDFTQYIEDDPTKQTNTCTDCSGYGHTHRLSGVRLHCEICDGQGTPRKVGSPRSNDAVPNS